MHNYIVLVAGILSISLMSSASADSTPRRNVDASLIPEQEWDSEYLVIGTALGGEFTPDREPPRMEPIVAGPAIFARGTPASQLTERPRATYQPSPQYPVKLKKNGIGGETVVGLLVGRKGHVDEVKVVSASHRLFAESAKAAVRQWRFDPGLIGDGVPADSIVVVRIRFETGARSPTTDALVNLALKSGSPDALAKALGIQVKHEELLAGVDACRVEVGDGISDLESFRITRDFLRREAPGKEWDISIPLDEGKKWKIRFVLLPTPGPIGSLMVDKGSGKISDVEINGKAVQKAEPGATDNPGDAQ